MHTYFYNYINILIFRLLFMWKSDHYDISIRLKIAKMPIQRDYVDSSSPMQHLLLQNETDYLMLRLHLELKLTILQNNKEHKCCT